MSFFLHYLLLLFQKLKGLGFVLNFGGAKFYKEGGNVTDSSSRIRLDGITDGFSSVTDLCPPDGSA